MALDKLFTIKPAKRKAIDDALLTEFTDYPVADSQVARIVKSANISRGAFYNYFEDLPDAYRYLYDRAVKQIHSQITHTTLNSHDYVHQTANFLQKVQNSSYYQLMQMHFRYNESYVSSPTFNNSLSTFQWSAMALSHETIRQSLLHPRQTQSCLDRLQTALEKLEA